MDVGTEAVSLSSVLRERTRRPHVLAERTGIVSDMLRDRVSLPGYALYLRNLLPAYQALERGLEQHRRSAAIGELARREVYKTSALESDLTRMCGDAWEIQLPYLPSGRRYVALVAAAAEGDGKGLIGHAYVRFFGDLNGGQTLRRLLVRSLDLHPDNLSFYDFPAIDDLVAFKRSYREALDRAGEKVADWDAIVLAALDAFSVNIAVSVDVRRATLDRPSIAG